MLLNSLTKKLAFYVAVITFAFTALLTVVVTVIEFNNIRTDILRKVNQIAVISSNPAADSVFYLDDTIAKNLLEGVLSNELILSVTIYNDYGELFVQRSKPGRELKPANIFYETIINWQELPRTHTVYL